MSEPGSAPVVQLHHEFAIVSEKNESIATATIERMHGVLWLTNVWTHHEHRRKGYARLVVQAAVDLFEAGDIWLNIHPYVDRPLDPAQLARFYESFGFRAADTPGAMRRLGDERIDSRDAVEAAVRLTQSIRGDGNGRCWCDARAADTLRSTLERMGMKL